MKDHMFFRREIHCRRNCSPQPCALGLYQPNFLYYGNRNFKLIQKKRSGTSQIGNHDLCARIFIYRISNIGYVITFNCTTCLDHSFYHEFTWNLISIHWHCLISKRLNLKLFFLFIMSAIFIFFRSENIYFTWYLFV